jgi:prepilin peptidase CpaA
VVNIFDNPDIFGTVALVAAAVVVTIAVYTDLRFRKIPDSLTVPAAALGLILNALGGGWHGLLFSSIGLVVGIAIFIIPFALRGMGGGDVKLMGALGALLGGFAIVSIALYTMLLGGVLAVIMALYNHQLGSSLSRVTIVLRKLVPFIDRSRNLDKSSSLRLPYGLAIGGGTALLFFIGRVI